MNSLFLKIAAPCLALWLCAAACADERYAAHQCDHQEKAGRVRLNGQVTELCCDSGTEFDAKEIDGTVYCCNQPDFSNCPEKTESTVEETPNDDPYAMFREPSQKKSKKKKTKADFGTSLFDAIW